MNIDTSRFQSVLDRMQSYSDDLHNPFFSNGWLIATNGHAMVAARAEDGEPYTGDKKSIKGGGAAKIIDIPLGQTSLPIASLRAATVNPPLDLPPCAKCGSTGQIDCSKCEGSGEIGCECLTCGDDHSARCRECGGTGGPRCGCGWTRPERKSYPPLIVVGGGTYNAQLLGEYLAPINAETFRFTVPSEKGPWVIGGDDWRVAIMPMRAAEKERATATVFALPTGEVAA